MVERKPEPRLIGCLLDVSGSMRKALEAGGPEAWGADIDRRNDRLHAILRAALKLARAEWENDENSLVFVGLFGLDTGKGCPSSVDLGSVVEALLRVQEGSGTGHDRLIELANRSELGHVSEYIRNNLSSNTAALVHDYLRIHPERISEFVEAIPTREQLDNMKRTTAGVGGSTGAFAGGVVGSFIAPGIGTAAGAALGGFVGGLGSTAINDKIVESSEGLILANRIAGEWFREFTLFAPRPAKDVSLEAFRTRLDIPEHLLVLISDGISTDGDPVPHALRLKEAQVTIATLYLTDDKDIPERQQALFNIARTLSVTTRPIPVLISVGWEVPSSGEASLYASVCSSTAMDEFCSLLMSERLGNTDALLDVIGRIDLDKVINDSHVVTCNNPSNQEGELTCYAHAIAAVAHMALCRIVRKDGKLVDSIATIRGRIETAFPANENGGPTEKALQQACEWYNLKYRRVDERGARQAVFRRRPVLATFRLSHEGWKTFYTYFENPSTMGKVLRKAIMNPHRFDFDDAGGHAVVLYACNPHSLSFLNSWGNAWGNNGTFSIENASTLERNGPPRQTQMRFYDVFWYEHTLPLEDRQAYRDKADRDFLTGTMQHPAILDLEATCPLCEHSSFLGDFTGTLRSAICPHCEGSFAPEPGYLMQALYARAGLGREA
ncbi:hypothetical protein BJX64DRAFT_299995 [Aspergillus heterothallicus]